MVKQDPSNCSMAGQMMRDFGRLTGLSPANSAPLRYLWTDAFAVTNFLGLYEKTGEEEFRTMALQLVDQVHEVLGQHRKDDSRTGWISGLDEQKGRFHPTAGGLRIGKKLKERRASEPLNERLEWDRDGQYYHYLTKWMHALNCVTRLTGDFTFNRWAVELAKACHARFVYSPSSGRQKRMYWKLSIDLSYPLVSSTGFHDPLDGLVTYTQLQATAAMDPEGSTGDLQGEIADMTVLCKGRHWASDDPLGIGGLLCDAFLVAQLMAKDHFSDGNLLASLLDGSLVGLEAFHDGYPLGLPAAYRLAFRELGLSIGLHAVERLSTLVEQSDSRLGNVPEVRAQMRALNGHGPTAEMIETFWLVPEHQQAESWVEHRDINMVMLATSLCPNGFLTI
jgi:hypothetical protein